MKSGSPDIVRCAALVDRGHRKFPAEPEFCGLECPTKLMEHVHVDLIPDADSDQVVLYQDAEHFQAQ
jgi:pyrimidine operon attenuation protein/uracil phosphoribosyltransferase